MIHSRIALLVALAAVVGVGCKGSTSVQNDGYVPRKKPTLPSAILAKGEELAYMPLNVGNQWTYEFQEQRATDGRVGTGTPVQVIYKVVKVTPDAQGKYAVLQVIVNDKMQDQQVWCATKSGIYQVATGKALNRFSSPQPVFPFPAEAGKTFRWSGSGKTATGETGKSTIKGRIVGEAEIDAASGTYNAMMIESEGTLVTPKLNAKTMSRVWFVPNVGIARYSQELQGDAIAKDGKKVKIGQAQVIKLKSYSLKNS